MNVYLKVAAGVLIAVILSLSIAKQGKDISLLLSLVVGVMVVIAAITFFQPVVELMSRIVQLGKLGGDMLNLLLKAVGLGLICQITCAVCADAGNQTLGKTLQIMTTAAVLWLSIPVLEELLSLMESVLGAI